MEKKTKKRINRHKMMAMEALENNPESRNNDLELILQVWAVHGLGLTESQKYTIRTCGVEIKTLLRERQLIQAEGKFLPTNPEVLKKRRKLAAEYAENYSEV